MRWQESSYVFLGIDPLDVVHGAAAPVNGIGKISFEGGTVPWAYILGNLFSPCFLEFNAAVYVFFAVLIFFIAITCVKTFNYLLLYCDHKIIWPILGIVLFLLSPDWMGIRTCINYGGSCACLIIISIFIVKKHPILAGILLAVASCKPHLTALFFLAMLCKGYWKPLLTSCITILISWGCAAYFVQKSPYVLLTEMVSQGTENYPLHLLLRNARYGIFSILAKYHDVGISSVMLLGGICGIAAVAGLSIWVLRNKKIRHCEMLYYSIPAIVSTLWNYQQSHDRIILFIPMLATLVLFSKLNLTQLKYSALFAICLFAYLNDHWLNEFVTTKGTYIVDPLPFPVTYLLYISKHLLWLAWLIILCVSYNKWFVASRQNGSLGPEKPDLPESPQAS